jgi:hypothetical protein
MPWRRQHQRLGDWRGDPRHHPALQHRPVLVARPASRARNAGDDSLLAHASSGYYGCLVRLPNADRAVVEDAKIRDYLLSPTHPVGRFKSVFFVALGYSADQWELLREALLELARTADATPGQASPFGLKFEITCYPPRTYGSPG